MKLVIYGVGKMAEWIGYEFANASDYDLKAFCIEKEYYTQETLSQLPVVPFENIVITFPPDEYSLFVAIGLNNERERICNVAKEKGYTLANYLSNTALTSRDLKYGENTFISSGSRISPLVTVGSNSILIGVSLAHHVHVGHNCLMSNCTLGGNVEIGDNSFIGMNVAIQQNVKVGKKNIIGMGCMITKNTEDNQVYDVTKYTKLRSITSDQFEKKYLK